MMNQSPLVPEQPPPDDATAQVERARRAWQRIALRIRCITPSDLVRFLLVLGALTVLIWLAARSWGSLAPFVAGLAITYLLLPLVDRLSRWMPRWCAILVVFGALILAFAAAWAFIVPPLVTQIIALLQAIPNRSELQSLLNSLQRVYSGLDTQLQTQISGIVDSVVAILRDNLPNSLQDVFKFIVDSLFTVYNVLAFVLGLVIVPFFMYYVINDSAKIAPALNRMLPDWLRTDFWAVVRIADANFSRYLRGQLVLTLLGAVATLIGLTALSLVGFQGVDYTLLLSIFSGLTVLIPYVGFVLAVAAAFGVGVLTSWQTAVAMAIVVFVIKEIIDTLVYPIIVGRSVHLHAAIILILLVVLSEFGIVWVILAPPVAAAARDLFLYVYGRFDDPPRPAGLLPNEPPAQPADAADAADAPRNP
jgi:predicted PurR-regulated permease PerM